MGLAAFGEAEAWRLLKKGILTTSLSARFMPELADSEKPLNLSKPLIVPSSSRMPKATQEKLAEFVASGGTLMICPVIPTLDENDNPCRILLDFLQADPPHPAEGPLDFPLIGLNNVLANKIYTSEPPEGASVLATCGGSAASWKKAFPSGGTALFLGSAWVHSKHAHTVMLKALMGILDPNATQALSNNPNIWTVSRSSDEGRIIFAMNLFSSPMKADISCKIPEGGVFELGHQEFAPMEVKVFTQAF
jgi:hypothetical protein